MSTGETGQPAIIWTGDAYLVVWDDARAGGVNRDIYGVMLTADGSRMGGGDVLIADTPHAALSPEVAPLPGGQGFVVAFEQCEGPSATGCAAGSSVATVVLGADGKPAGAPPITISPAVMNLQRRPYLATDTDKVYVTYRDQVAGPRTIARLSSLDGAGNQTGPGVVLDEASNGQYPHVAVGPSQVALIYQRTNPNPEIVLALLSQELAMQREVVLRTGEASEATNPVVQWNTDRWVTAWEDARGGGDPAIYATVVDAQGTAMAAQAAYDENGNWPTIASGGGMTSLIGFYGYPGQRVFLARMQANGRLKPGQVVLDTGKFPAVAYNGGGGVNKMGEYAVVYENESVQQIMFARFECAD
jgi:hypothetical protein